MEKVKNCLLCGSTSSEVLDERKMHGYQVINLICNDCGFIYLSSRMSEEELNTFYKEHYRTLYQGQEKPTEANLLTQNFRSEDLFNFADDRIEKISRYLEIGASAGYLMEEFKNKANSDVVGVELGDSYRELSLEKGLKVYSNMDEMKAAKEEKFDLICMSHVLEHIPDPKNFIVELRDQLNEGGHLLLQVPNIYWHDSFEIAHATSFSPKTLIEIIHATGFKKVALKSHGYPISKLFPLYTTILAAKTEYNSEYQVQKDKAVRFKRNFGKLIKKIFGRVLPKLAWTPRD